MHLLIGALVAGVARWRRGAADGAATAGLPGLRTGPIRTVHALAGRIRFRVAALKGNGEGCERLVTTLLKLAGILEVRADERTGSLLLRYDGERLQPGLLYAAVVRLLGLEAELERTPQPVLLRELRELGLAANRAVYDTTGGLVDLWTGLLMGLALLGTGKLVKQGQLALPAGFTLLWWAVNGLSRKPSEVP